MSQVLALGSGALKVSRSTAAPAMATPRVTHSHIYNNVRVRFFSRKGPMRAAIRKMRAGKALCVESARHSAFRVRLAPVQRSKAQPDRLCIVFVMSAVDFICICVRETRVFAPSSKVTAC
jgi:hypothetical protein